MGKTKQVKVKKSKLDHAVEVENVTLGRKRDNTLDSTIIDAATTILAEVGFDRMTMGHGRRESQSGQSHPLQTLGLEARTGARCFN